MSDGAESAGGPPAPKEQGAPSQAPQAGQPQDQSGRGPNQEPGQAAQQWKVQGQTKGGQGPKPVPAIGPAVKPVRPTAAPARMRRRHWGLLASFLFVLVPLAAIGIYLWTIAEDQYASVAGFTVRQEEGGGASELIGGLAQLTGSNVAADGDILYEFILSQSLVRTVERNVGLVDHYASNWRKDPAFALWPDPTIEDLEWYWKRVVRISFDKGSGLIELRVLAFDPEMAREIAREVVRQSQDMINALNEQAREDAMRYARADLDEAVARLRTAREALTAFRTRTQIVDPEADIQGRMGVMNNLQQQLAEALIAYDLLSETATDDDPRQEQGRRRIQVIRDRIADERRAFATADTDSQTFAEDYPSLIAEFEGLTVDREFAEESYRAALAALDLARAKAERQSRYLATYIEPTLAESAEYPQRLSIAGIAALFLVLSWSVIALVYYSIRDRS